MSFGRAMLLGLALASAVAAQLAADPTDTTTTASLGAAVDGPTDHAASSPPTQPFDAPAVAASPPGFTTLHARPVPAGSRPSAAVPLWVAPKTSPPQA